MTVKNILQGQISPSPPLRHSRLRSLAIELDWRMTGSRVSGHFIERKFLKDGRVVFEQSVAAS